MAATEDESGPGRRWRTFFLAACLYTREHAGASEAKVADLVGVSEASIQRFEKAITFPDKNFERYAAAYADVDSSLVDGRHLIARAVEWWIDHGQRPLTAHESPETVRADQTITPQDVLRAVRHAEQREKAHAGTEPRPTSTRTHREAGG